MRKSFLYVRDIARLMRVKQSVVMDWIKSNKLTAFQVSGVVRIDEVDFMAFLASSSNRTQLPITISQVVDDDVLAVRVGDDDGRRVDIILPGVDPECADGYIALFSSAFPIPPTLAREYAALLLAAADHLEKLRKER